MTYCLGICVKDGMLFASDSRTNAGVDYVTSYSKMHLFNPAPDRLFVILSAGNLATTQEIVNIIQRDIDYPTGVDSLLSARYLFEAADYVGRVSQQVQQQHSSVLQQAGVSGEVSLILGGQIQGQPHGLMLIYPQGNHIEASKSTPYLQIGETKYGKPVLDRVLSHDLPLNDCARLALVSLSSTTMSNITVGPPYELSLYRANDFQLASRCKFEEQGEYLNELQAAWTNGLIQSFANLPRFEWETAEIQSSLELNQCQDQTSEPVNSYD
ncbi:MAG: 20S proteasome subunit A/B [Candidatus Thiodiazotropha sp. 6PLUC5]